MKNLIETPAITRLFPALAPEGGQVMAGDKPGWLFRLLSAVITVALLQLTLFDIKSTYADTTPVIDSGLTQREVDILGIGGERTLTGNNMGAAIMRSPDGKHGGQIYDFSHGVPVVWGVYDKSTAKGKIVVEYMHQHRVNNSESANKNNPDHPTNSVFQRGDVELVTRTLKPSSPEMAAMFEKGNGIQTYFKGINPLEVFALENRTHISNWDVCRNSTNAGCDALLHDIGQGAFETVIATVARNYSTSHAFVAVLNTDMVQWEESDSCGFLGMGEKTTWHAAASIAPSWTTMTSIDNATDRAHQTSFIVTGVNGKTCLPSGAVDAQGKIVPAVMDNMKTEDLDECTARSGAGFVSAGYGSGMSDVKTAFWHYSQEGSCGIPFIVMLVVAAVIAMVMPYVLVYMQGMIAGTVISGGVIEAALVGMIDSQLAMATGVYAATSGAVSGVAAYAVVGASMYAATTVIMSGGLPGGLFDTYQSSDGLFGTFYGGAVYDGKQKPGSTDGDLSWDPRAGTDGLVSCILLANERGGVNPSGITGNIFGADSFKRCTGYTDIKNPLHSLYAAKRLCNPSPAAMYPGTNIQDCKYRYSTAQDPYMMKEASALIYDPVTQEMKEGVPDSYRGISLPRAAGAKPKRTFGTRTE